MRFLKYISLISILVIALIYTTNITAIPNKIILLDGENLNINTVFGVNINEKQNYDYVAMQASSNISTITNEVKRVDYEVSLLDKLPIKTIEANIIPKITVIPVGKTIGLKLYTDGVLVVGMSEIEDVNKQKVKPYENSQIKEGDRIIAVNENTITCTADLIECVNDAKESSINIKYVRDDNVLSDNIIPAKTSYNEYKLGLWVRDAAARCGDFIIL